MGAEFEISSEEDKNEWSDSDEDEIGDEFEITEGGDGKQQEQDTASAIIRRWKQAQQEQAKLGEKRKLPETVAVADDVEDEQELKEDEGEAVEGEEAGEGEQQEGEGDEEDGEEEGEEEKVEEVPRVRKGPGSVSFALVLGQLLSPDGASTEAATTEAEESAQPAVAADPILKNFKKRTNRKLEAEKRRRREARDLALKKKLLKARDHRIPTVLNEPAEVRLRKLATRGAVQLFNVVRKQQKMMAEENTEELEKRNPHKAEKLSKSKFLELLQKTSTKKANSGSGVKREAVKSEEVKQEDAKPQWDVLSDDYMLGAALKDMPDEDADE